MEKQCSLPVITPPGNGEWTVHRVFDEAMCNFTKHFSNIFAAQDLQGTTIETIPEMDKFHMYHQKFDAFATAQLNVIPNYNINSTRKINSKM